MPCDREGRDAADDAPPFSTLNEIRLVGPVGCVGESPDPTFVAAYQLDEKERAALAAFLKSGLAGHGSPAAIYSARVALRRFNCLNCHTRDGEGGIPNDLANQMRLLEKAENADDVRPPLLTGVGHKTRSTWLKSVLTDRGRARPWMQLRMPQYGESNVGFLPEALTHLEGAATDDSIRQFPLNTQTIALGKQIIGKSGLGCISCHDIGGVANTGTRGPDLATIKERVRYDWYDRWMHQPLRMAPGTRMPQAFVDGKSTLTTVLDGDPEGQAVAMWSYLSLGPGSAASRRVGASQGAHHCREGPAAGAPYLHAGSGKQGDRGRIFFRSKPGVQPPTSVGWPIRGPGTSSMLRRSGTIAAARPPGCSVRSSGPRLPAIHGD